MLLSVHPHAWLLMCLAQVGAFAEGRTLGAEAVRIADAGESPYGLAMAYQGAGLLSLSQGEIDMQREPPNAKRAEMYYRQGLTLAQALGMRPLQAHCHRGLGRLYAKTGQPELARMALSTAMALYRGMAMPFWMSTIEAPQAQAARP
jgi:hypothetical protein